MTHIVEIITNVATGEVTMIEGEAPPLSVNDYRLAIDAHVEEVAKSRSYNSAAHLASYAQSTVPQWAAEAAAFVAWRDQVWISSIAMMDSLTSPLPISEVIGLLPEIEWPE